MAKSAFKKGRRACCFCGGFDLSKEHIWPEWAAKLLPEGDNTHARSKYEGWGQEERLVDRWHRQGPPKTIRIYGVCKTCNNGWMGEMEEEVRPWLGPILKREPVGLTEAGQRILANYLVMKAMVADQSRPGENVFSKGERTAFYNDRAIPEATFVTLYRYNHEPDPFVTQYNKETHGVFIEQLVDGEVERKGVANQTFRFGELFAQVVLLRDAEGKLETKPGFPLRIHPSIHHTLHWPPLFRLPPSGAYMIQHLLQRSVESGTIVVG